MFAGFEQRQVVVSGVSIALRIGGSGPALLLLHGYPQMHIMWRHVAPQLTQRFTVVVPDLRGYGDSDKPPSDHGHGYTKRVMAAEQVALMGALGFSRFAVCGHDRGARVAYRMALDHGCVERLAVLDIMPTLEQFERMGRAGGVSTYHWYFLAQPAPFPETLIGADPDYFLRHTLDSWCRTQGAFTDEAMAEYSRCFSDRRTIAASCEDYRAGATLDCEHDTADRAAGRRIECPLLALWGDQGRARERGDVLDIWRAWSTDVRGEGIPCGHFLPEELPDVTSEKLLAFF